MKASYNVQRRERGRRLKVNPRTPANQLRSSETAPLVTYTAYKLRQSTITALEKAAAAKGWSTAALVRDVLDGWAKRHGGK